MFMQQIDKNTFFEITKNFTLVPFTQSKGWWAMHSIKDENRFVFFVDSLEKPSIACMGNVMKRFRFKMLVIEGECLLNDKNSNSKQIRNFYREITQTGFDMIEIDSSLPYNALYEIGIRQAGFLRPAGMFCSSLTILFDLQKSIEYDKNWQKNLRRAEKHTLNFMPVTNPSDTEIEDYVSIHSEMKNTKGFFDGLSYKKLKALLQDNNFNLFFVRDSQHNLLAAIIVYLRKNIARSIYSTASAEGRQKSAAYFRDNEMYRFLQAKGIRHFDRGLITPSAAHKRNDIFLFKNGVKGDYVLYCGEWSWYKKQIYRPLMYFVKKYLMKRTEL